MFTPTSEERSMRASATRTQAGDTLKHRKCPVIPILL
jgi:hypothetical protein